MRMAELAASSGLPVATIKFYLREGLLPPGVSTAATRSTYDETHLRRLRLVRALTEVAGMRLDAVRAVLTAVDDDSVSWHETVGSAHTRLSSGAPPATERSRERVRVLLAARSWTLSPLSTHAEGLAQALDALDGVDFPAPDDLLVVYADAAALVAERDVAGIDTEDQVRATEQVVIGTLLLEPVLLTLRRIAQENVSLRRST